MATPPDAHPSTDSEWTMWLGRLVMAEEIRSLSDRLRLGKSG
jgi:hypothetical protein